MFSETSGYEIKIIENIYVYNVIKIILNRKVTQIKRKPCQIKEDMFMVIVTGIH